MKIDPTYYDRESANYSLKRYEGEVDSYIKYLFVSRLNIFLNFIEKTLSKKTDNKMLEIGCADGVVLQAVNKRFPVTFSQLVGIDISAGMIEEAHKKKAPNMNFYLRGEEPIGILYDYLVELGVHVEDVPAELEAGSLLLVDGGYYIYSFASQNSLITKLKPKIESYDRDYPSYKDYEKIIAKHFEIIDKVPYGLFVPKLWAWPSFGRFCQSKIDRVIRLFGSELFHEQIYLLKKRKS
jgi:SAM-dependent methyltransferase